jgi:hypothetical protein
MPSLVKRGKNRCGEKRSDGEVRGCAQIEEPTRPHVILARSRLVARGGASSSSVAPGLSCLSADRASFASRGNGLVVVVAADEAWLCGCVHLVVLSVVSSCVVCVCVMCVCGVCVCRVCHSVSQSSCRVSRVVVSLVVVCVRSVVVCRVCHVVCVMSSLVVSLVIVVSVHTRRVVVTAPHSMHRVTSTL